MNYNPNCGTCHGLNSMGFCQYTACRFPVTNTGAVNASAYTQKSQTNADCFHSMMNEELVNYVFHNSMKIGITRITRSDEYGKIREYVPCRRTEDGAEGFICPETGDFICIRLAEDKIKIKKFKKEQEKCTAALTNEELLKNLKYCSCDPYYMDWWEETCKEIADRLFVKWEEI